MSLASALSAATTGLGAVARGTEVVATNIANANTEGYGRRELQLTSSPYLSGVRIEGVARMVNAGLLGEVRIASAGSAHAGTLSAWSRTAEAAVGIPGDGTSLPDQVTAFESALIRAAAQPESELHLSGVLDAAKTLTESINRVGTAAQDARQGAENAIARDVNQLNTGLSEVARLNRAIVAEGSMGRDTSSLQDARQKIIDSIGEIIPLREVTRDHGAVSLFTANGAALLDGQNPVKITFTPVALLTADMTATTGGMPGFLNIDGRDLTANQMGLYAGGRLEANFTVRDRLAPALQAQADELAADLAARFGAGGPDTTIATGAAGLFTDAGAVVGPSPTAGLAQRLDVNALADPTRGGELRRLRDGLHATTPGPQGDARLLNAMRAALEAPQTNAPLISGGTPRGAGGLAIDLSALASTARLQTDATLANRNAHSQSLQQSLAAGGVDTDAELQRLLKLEQAYAANARVIRAADDMLGKLLEI